MLLSNRILVLVPTVPVSLEDKVPWHFFQDLRGIAHRGSEVCVVTSRKPQYEIQRVEFRELSDPHGSGQLGAAMASAKLMVRYWGVAPVFSRYCRRGIRMARMNFNLLSIVRAWKPQVVHSHWAYPGSSAGWLAARASGLPLVMTLRGIDHLINRASGYGDTLDPFRETVLKQALNAAACVTICCTDSESRLRELGFQQWGKVKLVYHAVDAARFQGTAEASRAIRQRLGLSSGKVVHASPE